MAGNITILTDLGNMRLTIVNYSQMFFFQMRTSETCTKLGRHARPGKNQLTYVTTEPYL